MESIQISNLGEHESWIPTIALWHHNEWLNTHEGLEGRDRSPEVIERKLHERHTSLQKHICSDVLPTTFVAHQNNEPLGTVSLVYYQFTNDHCPTEWLTNLFVRPENRQQGIASMLLSCAVNFADACELPRLLLYTDDQVEFYRKRNWRSINRGLVQGKKVEIMDYVLHGKDDSVSMN